MTIFHQGMPTRLTVLGDENLTVSTTSVALDDIPVNGDVLSVFIEVQGAAIRWRATGADALADSGHKLEAGETAMLSINPADLRFIRDTAESTDATLVVDYLGV
jgi:hypothetical protein